MHLPGKSNFARACAGIFGSLEKRLIGALLLIAACTIAAHFISQHQAFKLREQSEALREAASNAERAEQLVRVVNEFRLAAHIYSAPGDENDAANAADHLTDAAIRIGDEVNALRLQGISLPTEGLIVFGGIDGQVADIMEAGRGRQNQGLERAVMQRNEEMAAIASVVRDQANAAREDAQERLSRSTRRWQFLVSLASLLTVGLILAILIDFLRNILPALRRIHRSLRQLAEGDLDVEIGEFRLRELQALSGPLETFRRNAIAVKNLAFTDPSTGLPNRRAFVERATKRLQSGPLEGERGFALMLADIDRFKHVNDDYGHAVGDRLVQLIGERFARVLGPEAIIARVGGDEFALCIPLPLGQSAASIGSQLVVDVRPPIDLGDFTVAVSISLGIVECIGCNADADIECDVNVLLNHADLALYASKHDGRNRATVFTAELEEERELNRALERDLANAFGKGQLRLVYQPIHSIGGGENEVEALVRWRHPVLGEISPARFIPAAERSGVMVQLGAWIMERALGDLARWPGLTMSLNLSPLQLQQEGFVGFLMDCCRKNAILPSRLILEVTESLSIERNTRAIVTLNLLRAAGFRIALDDFGTGYSSLCMMKTFKFDRLKLDRSLISDIGRDTTSKAVFDAAVTMALSIGAEVVAEGISDEWLEEPVRSAGCTHVQGFHYSRPIESEHVDEYYRQYAAARAA